MAVVLSLLIRCLLCISFWDSVIVLCFEVRHFVLILVFAIILIGNLELVALLSLSFWCLVIVVWLILAVPRWCLQLVSVVLSFHTPLLYFEYAREMHIQRS